MKYSDKEQFKNDVEELLKKIGGNVVLDGDFLTATLNTSFSFTALGSMHLLDKPPTSKNITINLDNYFKVNKGNLEEQYLNKCMIYVLTGFKVDSNIKQEAKRFLNEKMDEMINKPSVQLDLVTAELSKLRNNLKKWNGTDDVATIADGIDLKSAVSTAMLVNKVADKLLGKNSRISTSVGNNSTVELLDSANTQGGGSLTLNKGGGNAKGNSEDDLEDDLGDEVNSEVSSTLNKGGGNAKGNSEDDLDSVNEDELEDELKILKELCTQPFNDYETNKKTKGRWDNVDKTKKDICATAKESILQATSIEEIYNAIDKVISPTNKTSRGFGGLFQTVKNIVTSPGELYEAAIEAQNIFEANKDKVQSSQNASSNKL